MKMYALQQVLLSERTRNSTDRVELVKAHFQAHTQEIVHPDTVKSPSSDQARTTWIYPQDELDQVRLWYGKNMFNPDKNPEWKSTGYLAVNAGGRCGYTLLAIACRLQDFPLIDFLLEHGANRELGCDGADILRAAQCARWELEPVRKSLEYIAQKPQIPDMYWVKRVLPQ